MRIKQRIDDFRVRELLAADYLQERGEYRVYRVTKRKLTSLQAAREIAYAAGVQASDVALAGLKDRQGVTTQHMSIRRGRDVSFRAQDLTVETVGFAREGLESRHSLGNAFEVALRGLMQADLDVLRDNVPVVRACGVVNYFDEQRFGNLRHNQGWIAQQLMRGEHEAALKRLLASLSPHDDAGSGAFKHALLKAWGDWSACRDIAGRFGQHHSVFEHLKHNDGDFAGAFFHVASRLRLIHLYAFQSHIWNRAVAAYVTSLVPAQERVVLDSVEGPLAYPSRPLPVAAEATFRLPGPGLEDVVDPLQRGWLEDALSRERMVAADFGIQGVSGFQLKGEERDLLVEPRHLRVRPPER
ncbi:MAG TPA: tRNA pseudouridine(13) synthase TruD, partial [Planctomycetota bacterium]|nr:tRNA pseudouridine(13) synthase TruD [Planctomycetota bacterium]